MLRAAAFLTCSSKSKEHTHINTLTNSQRYVPVHKGTCTLCFIQSTHVFQRTVTSTTHMHTLVFPLAHTQTHLQTWTFLFSPHTPTLPQATKTCEGQWCKHLHSHCTYHCAQLYYDRLIIPYDFANRNDCNYYYQSSSVELFYCTFCVQILLIYSTCQSYRGIKSIMFFLSICLQDS